MEIEQIKKSKLFHKWDIVIYLILIVLIALSFIIFLPKKNSSLSVIEMKYKNDVVLTYSFDDKEFKYIDGNHITIEQEGENYLITFFESNENSDYNVIKIDILNKQVTMELTDCSTHKDCMSMKITKSSDTIICLPHSLSIYVVTSEIIQPTVG